MAQKNGTDKKTFLALDTSSATLIVAIAVSGEMIASDTVLANRKHLELSIPTIADLMKKTGLKYRDLDAIVVGLGPGSLIGTRVGLVIAKTLAQVLKLELFGISTLDAIAQSEKIKGSQIVIMDALKSEFYWAFYEDGRKVSEPKLGSFEKLQKEIEGKNIYVMGSAIKKYREKLFQIPGVILKGRLYPAPRGLVKVGASGLGKKKPSELYKLEPIYLRGPV